MKSLTKMIAGLGVMAAAVVSPIKVVGDNHIIERNESKELTYEVHLVGNKQEHRVVNGDSAKDLIDMVSMPPLENWPDSNKAKIKILEEKDRIDFTYFGLGKCRESPNSFYFYVAAPSGSLLSGSQELIVRDGLEDRFVPGVDPKETDSYKFVDRINDFLDSVIPSRGDIDSIMFDHLGEVLKDDNPYVGILDKVPGRTGLVLSLGKRGTQLALSAKDESHRDRISNLAQGYQISRIMPSQIKEFNLRDASNVVGRRILLEMDPKSKDPVYIVAARLGIFKGNQLRSREGFTLDGLVFECTRGAKGDLPENWDLDDLRGTYWIAENDFFVEKVFSFDDNVNMCCEEILESKYGITYNTTLFENIRKKGDRYLLDVASIDGLSCGETRRLDGNGELFILSKSDRGGLQMSLKTPGEDSLSDYPGAMRMVKIFEKRKSTKGKLGAEFENSSTVQNALDVLEEKKGYRPLVSYDKPCSAERGEGECLHHKKQLVARINMDIKYGDDPKDEYEFRVKRLHHKCPSGGTYLPDYSKKAVSCDIHGRLDVYDLPENWR